MVGKWHDESLDMGIREVKIINDETRHLSLDSGETVVLRLENDSVEVYIGNDEIGRLDFRVYEVPRGSGWEEEVYHLTHAFIEGGGGKYKYQGIGTEAIRLLMESTGAEITFSDNDGQIKDDGSHLTGDGPGFVESIRRKIKNGEL